jgi:nuclear RNA export factor
VSNKGYAGSSTSQNLSSEARETIKAFVASKYNAEALSLDLEGCSEQLSSQTGATFANTRFVQEICNIIRDHIPDVRTVNFSNNNITTLSAFRFLAKSAPSLLNICLRSNSIKSIKELDYLRGYSDTLNELILSDNPCVASASPAMYQHEVLTRFPFCKYLDGSQPQPLIQFNLANESTASKVPEDQGSFFDSESSQANAIAFVNQYFPLYDSNRQGLLSAYAHDACFSVTVSKNARGLPKEYCTNSRNLVTSASLSAPGDDTAVLSSAVPLMLCKPLNIVYTLDSFPATSHDLDTMTADSFVVPSTTTTGGNNVLAVSINGTFLEKGDNDKTTIREFHRTFLLIPPRPADNTQWPIVILNDQLHIFDGPVTAKPPALPSAVPAAAPAANGAAPPQQMAMVQQLSQQFQVDSNLATQALSSNNWNYEVIISSFFISALFGAVEKMRLM